MTSYWYATNGLSQRRLSNRHLSILDQAYEEQLSIQIYDEQVFGVDVLANANPYQGTMTASDLHYGLYRQPPLWRMSDTSLDTLILIDNNSQLDEAINKIRYAAGDDNRSNNNLPTRLNDSNLQRSISGRNSSNSSQSIKYKYTQKKRMMPQGVEEHCICCRIS